MVINLPVHGESLGFFFDLDRSESDFSHVDLLSFMRKYFWQNICGWLKTFSAGDKRPEKREKKGESGGKKLSIEVGKKIKFWWVRKICNETRPNYSVLIGAKKRCYPKKSLARQSVKNLQPAVFDARSRQKSAKKHRDKSSLPAHCNYECDEAKNALLPKEGASK